MSQHKVKITARLRPPIPSEIVDDGIRIEAKDDGVSFICVSNPRDASEMFKYPFTSCYDQHSTQEEIFENDVLPLVDVVYQASTVTIFAYGVTSSGKTHTMQGSLEQPGVIPRAVEALFSRKDSVPDYRVSITMSYFEIYKDECYDLLVERANGPKLPVREDGRGQVFVANLSSAEISSLADFTAIYYAANQKRSVGSTNLNRASSRSHAILTLEVKMQHTMQPKILRGKINLVDLAGSENNKLTGNEPSRMAESAAINTSLSVLGQVVHALNRGDSRIPYRNSRLTRILQDALGGQSVGLLICNLSPGVKFRSETLNTLRFASRARNVENKPVINEQCTRPIAKPHFSKSTAQPMAEPAPLPQLAQRPMPRPSLAVSSVNVAPSSSRTALQFKPERPTTNVGGPSRVPRRSIAGTTVPYPGANLRREGNNGNKPVASLPAVSEEDIDDRINKAVEAVLKERVEAEVAKRLEALEKQRHEEAERQETSETNLTADDSVTKESSLPPHVLAPLLKRHEDLDVELRKRLEELEAKYERNNSHVQVAQGLSPVSRKKTGRAYVALARAHSEKGELQIALDLYRKAESYVPDNVKLKERIIEIEWAIKHGREFNPSPKRTKKSKARRKDKISSRGQAENDTTAIPPASQTVDSDDDNAVEGLLDQPGASADSEPHAHATSRSTKNRFGTESTNSPSKRDIEQDVEDDSLHTPPKRSRKGDLGPSADEWEPSTPAKSLV